MCNCLPLGRTKASELSDFPAVDTPLVTKDFQFLFDFYNMDER